MSSSVMSTPFKTPDTVQGDSPEIDADFEGLSDKNLNQMYPIGR